MNVTNYRIQFYFFIITLQESKNKQDSTILYAEGASGGQLSDAAPREDF